MSADCEETLLDGSICSAPAVIRCGECGKTVCETHVASISSGNGLIGGRIVFTPSVCVYCCNPDWKLLPWPELPLPAGEAAAAALLARVVADLYSKNVIVPMAKVLRQVVGLGLRLDPLGEEYGYLGPSERMCEAEKDELALEVAWELIRAKFATKYYGSGSGRWSKDFPIHLEYVTEAWEARQIAELVERRRPSNLFMHVFPRIATLVELERTTDPVAVDAGRRNAKRRRAISMLPEVRAAIRLLQPYEKSALGLRLHRSRLRGPQVHLWKKLWPASRGERPFAWRFGDIVIPFGGASYVSHDGGRWSLEQFAENDQNAPRAFEGFITDVQQYIAGRP